MVKKSYKWMQEDNMLVKEFFFNDFMSAMGFANKVADISDRLDHHPNMLIHDDNKVRITLTTRDVDSVTELDIEMANLIDH
ncbi:MAG TPA: 4a-hydroxytetrahydrobiopterin dehydratase, partial [Alphaproteobacteria bacterium]|nr:4a-hydroxytetrahydrobiopterin dehydratase [Alphaproteobacteria bacterium]